MIINLLILYLVGSILVLFLTWFFIIPIASNDNLATIIVISVAWPVVATILLAALILQLWDAGVAWYKDKSK